VTGAGWLDACEPPPPPALESRLRAELGASPPQRAGEASLAYVDAAAALLARLLDGGCTSRETALDLLTADALVTYAFEAASEDPDALDARARDAMTRISALAAGPVA
jgi:hypothetical protein